MTTDISSRGMLADLRISQWTARKIDRKASKEVAQTHQMADKQGAYYKSLIDSDALTGVQNAVRGARDYHWKMTLPWSDVGPRVLSSAAYFDYMGKMAEYQGVFDQAVQALLGAYPYHRQEAQRLLGSLFNDDEYPTTEALVRKFSFRLDILPLPVAGDFRAELSAEEVDRVRQDIEQRTRETVQDSVKDAYYRVAKMVERYVERLAKPDGTFRATMVDDVRELAEILPKLNFTGDPELDKLARRLNMELCPFEADALRNDPASRRAAYNAAMGMKKDLAGFFGV